MASQSNITHDYVCSILDYHPKTGVFTWKKRPLEHFASERSFNIWNKKCPGTVAGSPNNQGYWHISINKKLYKAHRLAILITSGVWPQAEVDHIDGNKQNNKIDNLRNVTTSQNLQNRPLPKNNTSGLKGVSFYKRSRKYMACIRANKKLRHLGYFDCPAAASLAYQMAAHHYFGSFAGVFK